MTWPRPSPDTERLTRDAIWAWLGRMTVERGAEWGLVSDEDVEVLVHDVAEIVAVSAAQEAHRPQEVRMRRVRSL